jgi:hypothetical protein
MIPNFNPNQVINQPIHVKPEQKEEICTICLENINSQPENEGMKEVALKCNHLFHSDCINKWLAFKHTCPTCREPVEINTREVSLIDEMSPSELLAIPDNLPQASLEVPRRMQNNYQTNMIPSFIMMHPSFNRQRESDVNATHRQIVVGFSPVGLNININSNDFDSIGVASIRRF